MNKAESTAVNTLLRGLGVHTAPWDHDALHFPTRQQTMLAAAMLADRANIALRGGLRGDHVRGCWPHLPAVLATYNCDVCGRAKVHHPDGYLVCPDDSRQHRDREAVIAREVAARRPLTGSVA